jgi:pyruvate/2-oxoglutarate dehydrogenase complex dihydrolipoamide acyltransferase (E2) component
MATEFRVPPLGPAAHTARITRWYADPGDRVRQGDVLVELKAELFFAELAAPVAGVLGELEKPAGVPVSEGDLLAMITELERTGEP